MNMTEIPITPYDSLDGWRVGDPSFLEGERCTCLTCDRFAHHRGNVHTLRRPELAEGFIIWSGDGFASRGPLARKCAEVLLPALETAGEPATFTEGMRHNGGAGNILRYVKDPAVEIDVMRDGCSWRWLRRYRPHRESWGDWCEPSGGTYNTAADALNAAAHESHIDTGDPRFHRLRAEWLEWSPGVKTFLWPPLGDPLRSGPECEWCDDSTPATDTRPAFAPEGKTARPLNLCHNCGDRYDDYAAEVAFSRTEAGRFL